MIGHYLLTLSEEQEGRVLTQSFQPIAFDAGVDETVCGCLVMTATGELWERAGASECEMERRPPHNGTLRAPGWAYEVLCRRFGTPRVNNVIRNRILANRARRTLHNRPASLRIATRETVVCVGAGPTTETHKP